MDQEILEAVQQWAKAHPNPDTGCLIMGSLGILTPAEIAKALETPTSARGEALWDLLENALDGSITKKELIASFIQEGKKR